MVGTMVAQSQKSAQGVDEFIEWMKDVLEAKDWTPTQWARSANLAPSTVLRYLNDEFHKERFQPSLKTLQKLSEAANVDVPIGVLNAMGLPNVNRSAPIRHLPGSHDQVPAARPVMHLKQVSSLPSDVFPPQTGTSLVSRPAHLDNDRTAFAFHLPGKDLEPWFKRGSLCYATKLVDPSEDDIVLITDKQGRSKVRLVVDVDSKGYHLSKTMPPSVDEVIPFDEVKEIAVVTGIIPK